MYLLNKLLVIIPVLLLLTFANVLICFIVSQTFLFQLIELGLNKNLALIISVLVAIGTYTYIIFNHKIRNLLSF
jgi:hypothetical protein